MIKYGVFLTMIVALWLSPNVVQAAVNKPTIWFGAPNADGRMVVTVELPAGDHLWPHLVNSPTQNDGDFWRIGVAGPSGWGLNATDMVPYGSRLTTGFEPWSRYQEFNGNLFVIGPGNTVTYFNLGAPSAPLWDAFYEGTPVEFIDSGSGTRIHFGRNWTVPTATATLTPTPSASPTPTQPPAQYHPADSNQDWSIVLSEMTAYASAWKRGASWPTPPSPIDINYMVRAMTLWRQGEVYHYDASQKPPLSWQPGASGNGPTPTPVPVTKPTIRFSIPDTNGRMTVTIQLPVGDDIKNHLTGYPVNFGAITKVGLSGPDGWGLNSTNIKLYAPYHNLVAWLDTGFEPWADQTGEKYNHFRGNIFFLNANNNVAYLNLGPPNQPAWSAFYGAKTGIIADDGSGNSVIDFYRDEYNAG